MRFSKLSVIYPSLLAGLVLCHPVEYPRTSVFDIRDLLGLLGDNGNIPPAVPVTPTPTPLAPPTITSSVEETREQPTRPRMEPTRTTSISAHETYQQRPSTMTDAPSSYTEPTTTVPSSETFIATGYVADESTTPPAELRQWKVIGIAVITVTFLAIVILAVSFFDSWWGFVCDAICGKGARKTKYGNENMVPDWGKRSWEFKLANEDGHRYPTLASLESIVKEKDRARIMGVGSKRGLASPEIMCAGY